MFYAWSQVAPGRSTRIPTSPARKAPPASSKRLEGGAGSSRRYPLSDHGFDYPVLASSRFRPRGATRTSPRPRPRAAYALAHLTRLGLWDESSSPISPPVAGSPCPGERHAGAWDQQPMPWIISRTPISDRRDADAERGCKSCRRSHKRPPANTAYAVSAIPARSCSNGGSGKDAAAFDLPAGLSGLKAIADNQWAAANLRFANAVGAARSGDPARARTRVAELQALEQSLVTPPGAYDWKTQVSIERQIAEAWLAHAEGKSDDAVRLMRAAADLDDATEKHPVTPGDPPGARAARRVAARAQAACRVKAGV